MENYCVGINPDDLEMFVVQFHGAPCLKGREPRKAWRGDKKFCFLIRFCSNICIPPPLTRSPSRKGLGRRVLCSIQIILIRRLCRHLTSSLFTITYYFKKSRSHDLLFCYSSIAIVARAFRVWSAKLPDTAS